LGHQLDIEKLQKADIQGTFVKENTVDSRKTSLCPAAENILGYKRKEKEGNFRSRRRRPKNYDLII